MRALQGVWGAAPGGQARPEIPQLHNNEAVPEKVLDGRSSGSRIALQARRDVTCMKPSRHQEQAVNAYYE
jgi:hypothetical protein